MLFRSKTGAPGGPAGAGYGSDYGGAVSRGVSSAIALKRLSAEIANIEADTSLKDKQSAAQDAIAGFHDTAAALNVQSHRTRAYDEYATGQMMDLIRRGGNTAETLTMIDRIRRVLGLGSGR